jgi:ribonuclease Z
MKRIGGDQRMGARRIWKVSLVVGVLAVAAIVTIRVFQRPIGLALAKRVIASQMQRDLVAELTPGLHLGLCGTGSPMPDPTRAGPCVLVIAGKRAFVVDAGSGTTRNLLSMGLRVGDVEAVLLTHYHSDHIADLGELLLQRWAGGANASPTPVYGPAGVAEVVNGFNAAYRQDGLYRVAHHGPGTVPPSGTGGTPHEVKLGDESDASTIVLDDGDVRITMFRVDHDPVRPAVAYRFDHGDRSVVVSGDLAFSESMIRHAKGADLLAHEGLQPALVNLINREAKRQGRENLEHITADILSYHATPEQAATTASRAGVGQLVFYHVIPPLPTRLLYAAFLGDAATNFDGPITVGEDGMLFSLPKGGTDVVRRALL